MNRRNLLAVAAAGVFTPDLTQAALPHPDADLIAACERCPELLEAWNRELIEEDERGDLDGSGPASIAYNATRDLIGEAKPKTWAGVAAKARVAHAHAVFEGSGLENLSFTSDASHLAWDVVQDMLRLAGDGHEPP